jgi:hypothetical protein
MRRREHVGGNNRITEDLGDLLDLPVVVATEYRNWLPGWLESEHGGSAEGARSAGSGLSQDEIRFLEIIINNPGHPSSAYPKLAKMSTKRALAIRKRLVELNYLREEKVNVKNRGRACILLEPTPRASQLIQAAQGGTQ